MKVNREMVSRAGLKLLNEVGLEQLTLRLLARELEIQAATLYWHFKSKEELLDEMASMLLADAAPQFLPLRNHADWKTWVSAFGEGLRNALLRYRDGARMITGTKLTNTTFMKTGEAIGAELLRAGFTLRQGVVLLSTVYNYTLNFVIEEQAVYPRPGERSENYDLQTRSKELAGAQLPLMRQAGPILFDRFVRRYKEGLALIVQGAACQLRRRRRLKRNGEVAFRG
jgi:TetR/AcrR family transcriptional regulator, tetracycline repressor protein